MFIIIYYYFNNKNVLIFFVILNFLCNIKENSFNNNNKNFWRRWIINKILKGDLENKTKIVLM